MRMNPTMFIDKWLQDNPNYSRQIAFAAIKACCVDEDLDTGEECFALESMFDLRDLSDSVSNAIRNTPFETDLAAVGVV